MRYVNRHGRCRPCGVVFCWPIDIKVRVRDAYCPRCCGKLAQTATALLDTGKTPIVEVARQEWSKLRGDVAMTDVELRDKAVRS